MRNIFFLCDCHFTEVTKLQLLTKLIALSCVGQQLQNSAMQIEHIFIFHAVNAFPATALALKQEGFCNDLPLLVSETASCCIQINVRLFRFLSVGEKCPFSLTSNVVFHVDRITAYLTELHPYHVFLEKKR